MSRPLATQKHCVRRKQFCNLGNRYHCHKIFCLRPNLPERFSLTSLPSLPYTGTLERYYNLALLASTRPCWKKIVTGTNSLAYFSSSLATKKRSFVTFAPGWPPLPTARAAVQGDVGRGRSVRCSHDRSRRQVPGSGKAEVIDQLHQGRLTEGEGSVQLNSSLK